MSDETINTESAAESVSEAMDTGPETPVDRVLENRQDWHAQLERHPEDYVPDTESIYFALYRRGIFGNTHEASANARVFAASLNALLQEPEIMDFMEPVITSGWKVERASREIPLLQYWKDFNSSEGMGLVIDGFCRQDAKCSEYTPAIIRNLEREFFLESDMRASPVAPFGHLGVVLADLYHLNPGDKEYIEPSELKSVRVLLHSLNIPEGMYAEVCERVGLVAGFGKPEN